ncbi:MAG TPA: ATP-dependent sacrificial sulfur transferase LarE [Nitrososphaerales archaeon]|nr:ATP-dependent sacrificial sulfur transferase LarE [Nitrososphaerales archaeon]
MDDMVGTISIDQSLSERPPGEILKSLLDWFKRFESCAVAFSGGVDSSLLAYAAKVAIGESSIAVLSTSPATPREEVENAERIASEIGIRLFIVKQDDLGTSGYVANLVNRCYFCRSNLAQAMETLAEGHHAQVCVDGTHADDMKSPRPGVKALREAGFRAPFVELGIGKSEIRKVARYVGLSNADRPSEACLSSRIAFGQMIDFQTLQMIERAEKAVREITGASTVRVRVIGNGALVEVDFNSVPKALEYSKDISDQLLEIGFKNVNIAEEGYVSGRMLDLFIKSEEATKTSA